MDNYFIISSVITKVKGSCNNFFFLMQQFRLA